MKKILLIEDSKEIFTIVKQAIGALVDLDWAPTVEEARKKLAAVNYALILLDIELPDGNGIDFCSEIQSSLTQTAIFFLTSYTNLSDKVLGFSAGADDYITKPFAPLELKARVESKLR